MLRTLHLFAGAGGGLLADLILGHIPVIAVEWDKHCCNVLRERAADGWFPGLQVWEGDVRLFDPSEYAGRVDCIAAGFPCQDISAAGKGAGITGARSGLVREVFRAIDAIRPSFVFLENSPRIRTRGRDVVIGELVARGYAWRDGVLGAADVGAPHQRDRWWCLAADADGLRELESQGSISHKRRWHDNSTQTQAQANSLRKRCANSSRLSASSPLAHIGLAVDLESRERPGANGPTWFEAEPNVGSLVYGLADEMVPGAVKALGNAQVPAQAAAAWAILGGPMT